MKSGSGISGNSGKVLCKQKGEVTGQESSNRPRIAGERGDPTNIFSRRPGFVANVEKLPAVVRASVAANRGEYNARRLRSQREVIRDVMLAAADCNTWLTLGELRGLTLYGEASISAQLRHLRKLENGGYEVVKRHREDAAPVHRRGDERGECVWEYHIARAMHGEQETKALVMAEVSTC
jgi:hypothetical protein